jgi:hypothetical protein
MGGETEGHRIHIWKNGAIPPYIIIVLGISMTEVHECAIVSIPEFDSPIIDLAATYIIA